MKYLSNIGGREQASWLYDPIPGNIESLRKLISTRVDILYDGASLGLTNDPVPYVQHNARKETFAFKTCTPSKGKIAAINP